MEWTLTERHVCCIRRTAGAVARYYVPSIIASDDIEEAQYTQPMLTTVRLPREEMGKFTIDLLLDRLSGGHKAIVRTELEGNLMIRESCTSVENTNRLEYYI